MSKKWSEERRQQQAERCRANRPWEKSSGPKTEEGKSRASRNAFKAGGDTRNKELIKEILSYNRATLAAYDEIRKNELIKHQLKQLPTSPHPQNAGKRTESDSGLVSADQNGTNNDHD